MRLLMSALAIGLVAGGATATENLSDKKFAQLGQTLPTPNVYRDATGAPGPQYWQQTADYKIKVKLDEKAKRIIGSEAIHYTNNAPRALNYIWVQVDQNRLKDDSMARMTETTTTTGARGSAAVGGDTLSFGDMERHQAFKDIEYGHEIKRVALKNGKALKYTIVDTNMRIDLDKPLKVGETIDFEIDWEFNLIKEDVIGGRDGYEHFPENDTYIYFMAQWFPRMVAFTDYTGWQHKNFLGRGEFALEFGDYEVEITVPEDHIVSSTGELTNAKDVLTKEQMKRLAKAKDADKPIYIVTPEEAVQNEAEKTDKMKTWVFKAEKVRDFAFSSSRKYIWDAMGYKQDSRENPEVMAMSFYPQEADPLWSKYSTHSVIQTMETYSKYSFPYPYPTAQSVNTWERGGMEYPMITFNGYRPTKEKNVDERTYTRNAKYGLIGVIIHEVGHIYFPMIVNSDERQWTWMDEGLNTFLEYVTELEWEEKFPAFRGKVNVLDYIPEYMTSAKQVPIMTNSESILQFGPNAYSKPAAALTVLRETVMGRELFDHAFRTYANRWKFKRPTPADFFRTMEDASGVDLDWFWRGWFYTTDHVDMAVADVREYRVSTQNPNIEFDKNRAEFNANYPHPVQASRNIDDGIKMRNERYPELNDFYNENDQFLVTNADINEYNDFLNGLSDRERKVYDRAVKDGEYVYFIEFANKGGLISPLPITFTYEDGSIEEFMVPAEVWRKNDVRVTQRYIRDKKIVSVEIDRKHQTGEANFADNSFPQKISSTRLELYKGKRKQKNLMKRALEELKTEHKDGNGKDAKAMPMQATGR